MKQKETNFASNREKGFSLIHKEFLAFSLIHKEKNLTFNSNLHFMVLKLFYSLILNRVVFNEQMKSHPVEILAMIHYYYYYY